eukprot:TRINITY_DN10934_c0_g1_i1.p1 TRINITY_DN10934_c0_g1~~TRINITY_DN10934_c0_g1_i1.p1  ORF type:complete len:155 (+),score=10.56 TRINITY_DN10934_c0_g1_i1:197-661(+)
MKPPSAEHASKKESRTLTNSSMWVAYGRKKNLEPSYGLPTCRGTTLEKASCPLKNTYLTSNLTMFGTHDVDNQFTPIVTSVDNSVQPRSPRKVYLPKGGHKNAHTKYHAWSSEKPPNRHVIRIISQWNTTAAPRKATPKKRIMSILRRIFLPSR